jgi:hypothetical protein
MRSRHRDDCVSWLQRCTVTLHGSAGRTYAQQLSVQKLARILLSHQSRSESPPSHRSNYLACLPSHPSIPITMKFSFAILAVFLASASASPVLEARSDVAIVERGTAHPKRGAAFNTAGAVSPLAAR